MDYVKATKIFGFRTFAKDAKSLKKLKKKYRKLAKARHPDIPGGSKDAFQELAAAYDCLLRDTGHTKSSARATPSKAFSFREFAAFLAKYEGYTMTLDYLLVSLGVEHRSKINEWLNMANELGYISRLGGEVSVDYSPPGLTIERFDFMYRVRFTGGFKGNDDYKEAETAYKVWWAGMFQ